jgi:hypothetical protein
VIIWLSLNCKSGIVALRLADCSSLQFCLVGKWRTIAAVHTLTKIALIIRNQVSFGDDKTTLLCGICSVHVCCTFSSFSSGGFGGGQNANNRDLLIRWGVLSFHKSAFICGSGAESKDYFFIDNPDGVPVISSASRLLKDKAVVEASLILKNQGVDIRFWLIGEIALGNSNSVTKEQFDIVSLPSYYGEGLPKVLIEAAACRRSVTTTDHPCCRDAIESDSGLSFPIRDSEALVDEIQNLVENPVKRKTMVKAGLELAGRKYAIEKILHAHIHRYNKLISETL